MAAFSLRLDLAKEVNRHFLENDYCDLSFLSYFFVKKIPLSRRVGCVMDGWIMVQWISGEMYVCHTNQIGSTINNQSNFLFLLRVHVT